MRQGDVYWLSFEGDGAEPAGRRPALVVQYDWFNRSAISTTAVAAITSNLRLAAIDSASVWVLAQARQICPFTADESRNGSPTGWRGSVV